MRRLFYKYSVLNHGQRNAPAILRRHPQTVEARSAPAPQGRFLGASVGASGQSRLIDQHPSQDHRRRQQRDDSGNRRMGFDRLDGQKHIEGFHGRPLHSLMRTSTAHGRRVSGCDDNHVTVWHFPPREFRAATLEFDHSVKSSVSRSCPLADCYGGSSPRPTSMRQRPTWLRRTPGHRSSARTRSPTWQRHSPTATRLASRD